MQFSHFLDPTPGCDFCPWSLERQYHSLTVDACVCSAPCKWRAVLLAESEQMRSGPRLLNGRSRKLTNGLTIITNEYPLTPCSFPPYLKETSFSDVFPPCSGSLSSQSAVGESVDESIIDDPRCYHTSDRRATSLLNHDDRSPTCFRYPGSCRFHAIQP